MNRGICALRAGTEGSPESVKGATTVDAAKAKALWDEGVLFVDVRADKDWEAGRIPSALHLNLNTDLSEKALLEEVGKDEGVVMYCNGVKCGRSSKASDGSEAVILNPEGEVECTTQQDLFAALGISPRPLGTHDLSVHRHQEQAASLEESASSIEQMTVTVKQNADNARQANQLASGAREQAEKGGQVVGDAVSAMSEISSASKKIVDIIGVIDEIAFQTNLLALNAAVEAARAGEQGRGFAVVASAVPRRPRRLKD